MLRINKDRKIIRKKELATPNCSFIHKQGLETLTNDDLCINQNSIRLTQSLHIHVHMAKQTNVQGEQNSLVEDFCKKKQIRDGFELINIL